MFLLVSLAACIAPRPGCGAEAAPERPNIVVILADDVGFSDLGCYGGEMKTPNLDALAAGGLRFTQFYNTARCCPTRASLLTGLYPHQAGIGHMLEDRGEGGYRGDLNKNCATIAEVLGDSGYRTYALGKWHVTRSGRPGGSNHNWPLQRGFDKYYGTIWGAASYFDPGIWRGNETFTVENDPKYRPDHYYFTDALSDNAVAFLQEHEKESPDKPFFLYQAYTAAHWPLHALEKDIEKYKGRFDAGYDALRKERVERLRAMGMMRPEWEAAPTAKNWDDVKDREWELRCMEVYAAMIDSMDQGVGRIVAELKRQERLDNTLILFMQDNGGCAEEIGRRPRAPKPAADAAGANTKLRPLRADELPSGGSPKQTRDGRPMRQGEGVMPGGPDTYLGYGEGWANVSNTPFREYKHWVHEGGIATPLIAHWPKGIPAARRNGLVHEPGHLIDVMATCVDAGQTTYPAERGGHRIKPMQGVSLRPLFAGEAFERTEPIFWEHEGNRAVRQGKWKLVAKEDRPWELYDMDADRTETHDLATSEPERARKMAARWDAYAKRSDVLPLGAWKKEPATAKEAAGRKGRVRAKAGQTLSAEESPAAGDSPLTVTVEIIRPKGDGVLAAQGGNLHGYALYVREGKLCFDVRRDGKLTTVRADEELDESPAKATAILDETGRVRLWVARREVAAQDGVGLLTKTPADGLSAGHDSGDPVGEYAPPFAYEGRLGDTTVQTRDEPPVRKKR